MNINFPATITAGILYFAFALAYYSPLFFGRLWLQNSSENDKKPLNLLTTKSMITGLVAAFFTAWGIACVLKMTDPASLIFALRVILVVWTGIAVSSVILLGILEGRSLLLNLINGLFLLLGFSGMTVILYLWK